MERGGNPLYFQPRGRITGFDFIRSIAIFLTLCRHSFRSSNLLWHIGWSGVHLFFVLSSFLIANILFTEYYETGKIKYFRFFTRRALKIYPLYYLFIVISMYKNRDLFLSSPAYKMQLIGQIFHVQNYTGVLWYHTWSLAAEEQFYVGMCLIISTYLFFSKSNGLRKLAWLFAGVILLVPFVRYRATLLYQTDWFMATHYIMDSFAFGALLALGKFVYPKIYVTIIQMKHWLLLPVAVFLTPLFLLPTGNAAMNSIGMTMMYLAFTLLIAWALSIENFARGSNIISLGIIRPLASIGITSYAVYLFHVPVKTMTDSIAMSEWLRIPVYFIACIAVGKITWYLIERPIALYKNKLLP